MNTAEARLFISWSGDLSHKLAEALFQWLPKVIQRVEPYMSSTSIEKGARWSAHLSKELGRSNFGIVVLTQQNLHSPWINFEAGAIAKAVDEAHLAPMLFGIRPSDVVPSLSQFQATEFAQTDFAKLLRSINRAGGEPLMPKSRLEEVHSHWWPNLQEQVTTILKDHRLATEPRRDASDMLEEVLLLVREQTIALTDRRGMIGQSVEALINQVMEGYFAAEAGLSQAERTKVMALMARWKILNEQLLAHFSSSDSLRYEALHREVLRFKVLVDEARTVILAAAEAKSGNKGS